MSNPICLFLKFRHYVVILFLKLFFTVIDQQACKLECGLKNYGQMQKTTDNVLFDYWMGWTGLQFSSKMYIISNKIPEYRTQRLHSYQHIIHVHVYHFRHRACSRFPLNFTNYTQYVKNDYNDNLHSRNKQLGQESQGVYSLVGCANQL